MNSHKEYTKVVDYIYRLVKNGSLRKGDSLPAERKIAEDLSIGRNSVREGLRVLENIGLTESRLGSGNYITADFTSTITQIFEVMIMVENVSKDDICQFRRQVDRCICLSIIENGTIRKYAPRLEKILLAMAENKSRSKLVDLDQAFHYCLMEAAENKMWHAIYQAISTLYRHWIASTDDRISSATLYAVNTVHRAIYQTLLNNDWDHCIEALNRHNAIIEQNLSHTKTIDILLDEIGTFPSGKGDVHE